MSATALVAIVIVLASGFYVGVLNGGHQDSPFASPLGPALVMSGIIWAIDRVIDRRRRRR